MRLPDLAPYLVVGLAAVVAPIITAVVVLRKLPAESRKLTVDTVDVSVTIADKVRDMAARDWERVGRELDEEREARQALEAKFDQYRREADARMEALLDELRGERAEKRHLAEENEALLERVTKAERRVDELEAEVSQLKAERRGGTS